MARMPIDGNGDPIPVLHPRDSASLAVSDAGPVNPLPFIERTTVIRVVASVPVHYSLGGAATTSSAFLPANVVEYISVQQEDSLSVLGTEPGTAWITEMV